MRILVGCEESKIGTLYRKTKKWMENFLNKIINGNSLEVLKTIPDNSIDCCITSPPYWGLRSYMPGVVRLKDDAPEWVIAKLKELNICPTNKNNP